MKELDKVIFCDFEDDLPKQDPKKNKEGEKIFVSDQNVIFNEESYYDNLMNEPTFFVSDQNPVFNEFSYFKNVFNVVDNLNIDDSLQSENKVINIDIEQDINAVLESESDFQIEDSKVIFDDFNDMNNQNIASVNQPIFEEYVIENQQYSPINLDSESVVNTEFVDNDLDPSNFNKFGEYINNFEETIIDKSIDIISPPPFEEYSVNEENSLLMSDYSSWLSIDKMPIINVDNEIKMMVDDIDVEYIDSFEYLDSDLMTYEENLADDYNLFSMDDELTFVENDIPLIKTTDFVDTIDYSNYKVPNICMDDHNINLKQPELVMSVDSTDNEYKDVNIIYPGETPSYYNKNNLFNNIKSYINKEPESTVNKEVFNNQNYYNYSQSLINKNDEVVQEVQITNSFPYYETEMITKKNIIPTFEEQLMKIKKSNNIFRKFYIASTANAMILKSLNRCAEILSKKK